ncbi:hypothetical protein D0U04_24320 [Bacillus clarus]|nr:hypothetical protein [Bacillus clarus]RFT63608.1 hypothetical protein D0U04_24320 [Bacillus clarus]
MHKPSFVVHSPYNEHMYTKVFIQPLYMQVFTPVVATYSQVHPEQAPVQPFLYGHSFYEIPYFKNFYHNVKAQVWDG